MCVLRATGAEFNPDAFLDASPFEPCKVFRRGDPRLPKSKPHGPRYDSSGISVAISEAPWSDLPAQVADAKRFLDANRAEIERLTHTTGVVDLTLDFPIELRIDGDTVVAQFDRFPAPLVRLAGALGIALELSIYPCSDE